MTRHWRSGRGMSLPRLETLFRSKTGIRATFAPARLPHHDLKRLSENLPRNYDEARRAYQRQTDRRKGNTMALERKQDGIRLSNDGLGALARKPPLHDKDITIATFQLMCVPIVEFSAPQSCEHECTLIASTT